MKKQAALVAIILSLSLALSACVASQTNTPADEATATPPEQTAYASQNLPLPSEFFTIFDLREVNGTLEFLASTDPYSIGGEPYRISLSSGDVAALDGLAAPENYGVHRYRTDADGNRYFLEVGTALYVEAADGSRIGEIKSEPARTLADLLTLPDGTVALVSYDASTNNSDYMLTTLDAGSLGSEHKLPAVASTSESAIDAYDFCYSDAEGIFGYSLETAQSELLFSFSEVGIAWMFLSDFVALRNGTVAVATYESNATLTLLTPTEGAVDGNEKITLTLASMGALDPTVAAQIAQFNRENTEYEIVATTSPALFSMELGVNYEMLDQFAIMLTTGDAPDIVLQNTRIPQDVYAKKGVFEDLYPYLNAETDIEIVPTVLTALETDGKLFQITTDFALYAVAAPKSTIGERVTWTVDEAFELASGLPLIAYSTQGGIMEYSMMFNSAEYIDWTLGECYFDSPSFIKQLELAASMPQGEPHIATMDDIINGTYVSDAQYVADGKAIAALVMPTSYAQHRKLYEEFGGDFTYIGYPRGSENTGNGSVFTTTSAGISITAASKHKDAAWAFVRTFLTEDFQVNNQNPFVVRFPTNVDALERFADEARARETDPITQEEIDIVNALIADTTAWERVDYKLVAIIDEEAAQYFARRDNDVGRVTAADAAAMIQSRASIYVSEQS